MKNSIKFVVGIGVVAIAVGIFAFANSSIGVQAQTGCSLETLNGNYIYSYDGFEVTGSGNLPVAYTGRETYNGDGTMTGIFSGFDSTGVTSGATYGGTYNVNADCTGTLITDPGTEAELTFDIYIDESTGNFYFTDTTGFIITQGFNRKVQN